MMMLTFRGEKNLKVGDCGDRTLFGAEIPSGDPQRSLRHKTGLEPLYKLFILIASEFITFFLHSLPFITVGSRDKTFKTLQHCYEYTTTSTCLTRNPTRKYLSSQKKNCWTLDGCTMRCDDSGKIRHSKWVQRRRVVNPSITTDLANHVLSRTGSNHLMIILSLIHLNEVQNEWLSLWHRHI
jgi:hypothetical protein